MDYITTLEEYSIDNYKKNWYSFLSIEKFLAEKGFNWLNLQLKDKVLFGKGNLEIGEEKFRITILYSPFFYDVLHRFDIIRIEDRRIKYSDNIHIYGDMSLCLYHPRIDKPFSKIISLTKIIPWITEWIVNYKNWEKYGVWLGKEIKH